ncbi:MAG TPA: GNAT family N-acetyltransferase, partial [Clostridiales bacterium]|nr:GNAT family N-acetyltransferase [Clostridiales bacterium]
MCIEFKKLSEFDRGILYSLLSDAYAFDSRYEDTYKEDWLAAEKFFFDNPDIGDKYCSVATLHGEAIGWIGWDPRNLPDYAIIGHNCIITRHKGKGYGKIQLQEAVNKIIKSGANKIYVSTDNELTPAQKMYESVGFKRMDNSALAQWQVAQNTDIYYVLEVRAV